MEDRQALQSTTKNLETQVRDLRDYNKSLRIILKDAGPYGFTDEEICNKFPPCYKKVMILTNPLRTAKDHLPKGFEGWENLLHIDRCYRALVEISININDYLPSPRLLAADGLKPGVNDNPTALEIVLKKFEQHAACCYGTSFPQ